MISRFPHWAIAMTFAVLPVVTGTPVAFANEDAGRIGAAFGDESQPWADPFPPQAFQEHLPGPCPALLDHRVTDIRGRTINLCAFSGKVLLVVNTASR